MEVFGQRRPKVVLKSISVLILHTFVLSNVVFAQGINAFVPNGKEQESTLAPSLGISDVRNAFNGKIPLVSTSPENIGEVVKPLTTEVREEKSISVLSLGRLFDQVKEKGIDTTFVACDLNVARDKSDYRKIKNPERIIETIPTFEKIIKESDIQYMFAMTHSGRPEAGVFDEQLSLEPIVADFKARLLDKGMDVEVVLLPHGLDGNFAAIQQKINEVKEQNPGKKVVFFFENIRFYPQEQSKNAEERAAFEHELIDLTGRPIDKIAYVSEAYSKAHRGSQASMELVNLIAKENRAAGATLSEEIEKFLMFEKQSKGRILAFFGGAKFDKWDAVGNIAGKVAESGGKIVPMGAFAHVYVKDENRSVGASLMPKEKEMKKVTTGINKVKESGVEVLSPVDFKVAGKEGYYSDLGADLNALDLGEQSIRNMNAEIDKLIAAGEGTIILNGGAGMFEKPEYMNATMELVLKAEQAAEAGITVFAVGGDMTTAIQMIEEKIGRKLSAKILKTSGGGVVLEGLAKGISNLTAVDALLAEAQVEAQAQELNHIPETIENAAARPMVVKIAKKVAIAGMGRIGRLIPRLLYLQSNPNFDLVAVVGDSPIIDKKTKQVDAEKTNAEQLKYAQEIASKIKYDTYYRKLNVDISAGIDEAGVFIMMNGKRIAVINREGNIGDYPWGKMDIDIVFEATGKAKKRDQASGHIKAGAKKVLISAPGEDVEGTYVYGVNEKEYRVAEQVSSNASCTTNCIAPTMKVLGKFGFDAGSLNTTHAATNSQSILDKINKKKPEQGFSALKNILLTSTGASKALKELGRKLWARMSGSAYRVPTGTVSVITLDVKLNAKVTAEQLKEEFKKAAEGDLKGILAIENAGASLDVLGRDYGAIVAEQSIKTKQYKNGTLVHMQIWYDNEWGYAAQLIRMAEKVAAEMENPGASLSEVYTEEALPKVKNEAEIAESEIPAAIMKTREEISLDRPVRVGINGMGRIGRIYLRQLVGNKNVNLVAIAYKKSANDVASVRSLVNLIKNDSVHGRFNAKIDYDKENGNWISINGKKISVLERKDDPADLAWNSVGGIDVAVENVGSNNVKVDVAERHLLAGARKVIIGAPAKAATDGRSEDGTYVFGINDVKFTPEQKTISNASCTTNCLAPVVHVLNKVYGVEVGMMSTTHAETVSQPTLDKANKKEERARAAGANIIVTDTGAAKAIGKVIPELNGLIDGDSLRVPVEDASIIKLAVITKNPVKNEKDVARVLKAAANGYLKGILAVDEEAVASSQIIGRLEASIVNPKSISIQQLSDGSSLLTLSIWYDNEAGYAQQEIRMTERMGKVIQEYEKQVEKENEELIQGLKADGKLQDYDERYLRALYGKSKGSKAGLVIGDNFIPSSMMSAEERKEKMGAVDYTEINNETYNKAAQDVMLVGNPMDGGLGSSFLRKRFLVETVWPQIKDRYEPIYQQAIELAMQGDRQLNYKAWDMIRDIKRNGKDVFDAKTKGKIEDILGKDVNAFVFEIISLGAKGTDTFFDIEIPGFDANGKQIMVKERVSVTEMKYLQALNDKDAYGNVVIQELVNDESEVPMNLFLDKTIYIYDRVDHRPNAKKRSYRQFIEQSKGIEVANDMIKQGALPTIDKAAEKLTTERVAPGGHGQLGSMALQDALTVELPKDKVLIRALYNGDGPNNFITPEVAGYMAKERIPIVMITTEKTSLDMKGGMLGLETQKNGKEKIQIIEKAQAEEAKQYEWFQKIGLPSDDPKYFGEAGKQFFNTNVAAINYSVLSPFLKDLYEHMESQGKADEFAKIVTPDLIKNVKKDDKTKKEFIQLEGAMGSALLNLNGFIQTTDDPKIKALLEKHGLKQLLYIVNFDAKTRNEVFTPVKFAWDFWFYAYTDHFAVNLKTFKVENKRPGHLAAFELDKYYEDVSNCINSFGKASTIDLDSLSIKGRVKMVGAVLRGDVKIVSEYAGVYDLNSPAAKKQLGMITSERLVIDSLNIFIDKDGSITVTVKRNLQSKKVSLDDIDEALKVLEEKYKTLEAVKGLLQSI